MNFRENYNQKNKQRCKHKEIVDNIHDTIKKLEGASISLDYSKSQYILTAIGILANNIPKNDINLIPVPPEEIIIEQLFEIKEIIEMHLEEFINSVEELNSEIEELEAWYNG